MKKQILLFILISCTTTFTQHVCVDKTHVEQVTQTLKNISAALAALAHKVELLLASAEQQETPISVKPKRSVDFQGWQEFIKNQPRDDSNRDGQE